MLRGTVCSPEMSMLALIQRVTRASVTVDAQTVGQIGPGLLALVGVEPGDSGAQIRRLAERMLGYRVFADDVGKRTARSPTPLVACCWSVSSLWLPTPAPATGLVSAPPHRRRRLNRCSINWWRSVAKNIAAGWKPGASVPIWLSIWPTMAR